MPLAILQCFPIPLNLPLTLPHPHGPGCLKIECDVCAELSQGLGLDARNDLIIKDVMTKRNGEFGPDRMLMDPRNKTDNTSEKAL